MNFPQGCVFRGLILWQEESCWKWLFSWTVLCSYLKETGLFRWLLSRHPSTVGEPSSLASWILMGLIMVPVFFHCCLKELELWRFWGVWRHSHFPFPIWLTELEGRWTLRGPSPFLPDDMSKPREDQTWQSQNGQTDMHLEKQSGDSFQRFFLSPGHAMWILF